MTKVNFEIPNGEYCDYGEVCPLLENGHFGQSWCPLYGDDLEVDRDNGYCFKRCDKCKQASGGRTAQAVRYSYYE